MNFTLLSSFRAVMTSANLSEAANKLGRTQPAVSAAIKTLEEQLGLKLFDRVGRRMVPVPEAQYLLAEAEEILSRLERVRLTMRGLVDEKTGNLTVAAMPGPVSALFPRFIAEFLDPDADVNVSLAARTSAQIAELARAQNIDFGFADYPEHAESETLFEAELLTGACFVAVPRTHRLAQVEAVSLRDLAGLPMGTLPQAHQHQKEVTAAFALQKLSQKVSVECQTFHPILQFIGCGRCFAIVDPLTVAHVQRSPEIGEDVSIRPLCEPLLYRYAMISPRYRPTSALAERLKLAWKEEVERILDAFSAVQD